MGVHSIPAYVIAAFLSGSATAAPPPPPACLSEASVTLECIRSSLLNDGVSRALAGGEKVHGISKRYTVTIPSDRWILNGWGGDPPGDKDLGLLAENATGFIDFLWRKEPPKSVREAALLESRQFVADLARGAKAKGWTLQIKGAMESYPLDSFGKGSGMLVKQCFEMNDGAFCSFSGVARDGDDTLVVGGMVREFESQTEEAAKIVRSLMGTRVTRR